MDLQKAKILLEKINSLYRSMNVDAEHISSIERDLMRNYIRQLYEVFLDLSESVPVAVTSAAESAKAFPKTVVSKHDFTPPSSLKPTRQGEPPKAEPVPVAPPPPVAEKQPAAPSIPLPTPKAEPVEKQVPTPQPILTTSSDKIASNAEMEELFAFSTARELSEKLGESPITDIKKAMGLNESILTRNELFGGDQVAFDTTIAMLNQLRSFEEAKNYLIQHVGSKYDWTSKDRKGKAKIFIKLVKRRYN